MDKYLFMIRKMGEEDVSWVSTWKPQNLNICPFFPSKLKKNSEGESISTILNSRPLNDLLIHVESILLHNFHLTLVPPMPRRTKICFVRSKTRPEKYKRLKMQSSVKTGGKLSCLVPTTISRPFTPSTTRDPGRKVPTLFLLRSTFPPRPLLQSASFTVSPCLPNKHRCWSASSVQTNMLFSWHLPILSINL